METKNNFWKQVALFFSGAMFWGAISHAHLAVEKVETVTFGMKIEADENWWAVVVHLIIASILFWLYKRKSTI